LEAEEVQLQEEKEALLQDEGSGGIWSSSAPREGGFGPRSSSAPRREGGFTSTDQEQKVHLIEHQDVQKTLVTPRPRRPRRD
jgi:ATP-dependent RNA helicase DeaD